jgi:chromosome segregation ATPase
VVLQAICQTYLDDRQFAANPGLRDRLNALDYVRIKAEASLKKLRSEMREKQPPEGRWPQMREVELSALIQQQTEAQQQAARALAAYNEAVANVRTDQIEQDKTNATLAADKARDIGNRVITLKEELEALQNLIANYETLRREEQGLVNQVVEVREQIKTATALQQSRADEIRWHLYPEVTPVR